MTSIAPASAVPTTAPAPSAIPPETIEGWYTLHQIFRIDARQRELLRGAGDTLGGAVFAPRANENDAGWSAAARLIGSTGDVMFVHFRPTLDGLGEAQRTVAASPWMRALQPMYSFLSVTESGLYYMTSQLAKATEARGGEIGDAEYVADRRARLEAELANAHTRRRLYPPRPTSMPYVCFYPMSKRRAPEQNWYALPLSERNRLMREHGLTGRKYAGRVQQVITGAIGFDAWEWGVTLFAGDPLEFKRLVTEMRFDEASAHYAEFGPFYVGKLAGLDEVLAE